MKRLFFFALSVLLLSSAAHAGRCTDEPGKTRISRVVAIDSTGGPVYGQAVAGKEPLPPEAPLVLGEKEIALAFDQGPHSQYTKYILDILDHHCVKAVFFFSGRAALANPPALRDAAQRGHTIAAMNWTGIESFQGIAPEAAAADVEKSLAAISKISGATVAPFVRASSAQLTPETLSYFKDRGISLWSYDLASGDNVPGVTATRLANHTIAKMREMQKGIIQFHDTRKVTVDALDSILSAARLAGFKIVQLVPASGFTPKEEYLSGVAAAVGPSTRSGGFVQRARRKLREDPDAPPSARPSREAE